MKKSQDHTIIDHLFSASWALELHNVEWGVRLSLSLSVKPDVQFSRGRFGVAAAAAARLPWATGPAERCNGANGGGGGDTLATRPKN